MKIRWGRVVLSVIGGLAVIGAAALIAPELDAERMRGPLATALEETLGRKVEFREVHYQILPAPGLSAVDLVIPDDPAFGLEPLAYVGEMQARISFSSLFTGRLSISSVRLGAASVNLTRRDEHGWNLARLLQRMAAGVGRAGAAPRVVVSEGRVNFKNGTLKSPFYLNAVDLDLQPVPASGGALEWRYEASPARTDRAEQGFGRFSGGGKWRSSGSSEGEMAIDMVVERSAISEVLTLITGRDLGLQGRVSARATLDGPLQNLKIRGTVEVDKVDRPGWFGLRGQQWALGYEGAMDLSGQTLELHTVEPKGSGKDKQALPLMVELACKRLLADPRWDAKFSFDELPAPALLEFARRLGVPAPPTLTVEGNVVGTLGFSSDQPLAGNAELRAAKVSMGPAGPLAIETAQISLAGNGVTLAPVTVESASGSRARISGLWRMDTESLEFAVDTDGLLLSELRSAVESFPNVAQLPLLEACRDGSVRGSLRYQRGPAGTIAEPAWSGRLQASEMTCEVEGAPDALRIDTAMMSWNGAGWSARKAKGAWGPWRFTGEADFTPDAKRPWRFNLSVEEATGAALDRFFQPALLARRSLLDRTLRRRVQLPAWLLGRHAEGKLRIGRLLADQEVFSNVAARLYWDGETIELPEVNAQWNDASLSGRLRVRLGGIAPDLRFLGRVDNYHWKGGLVDSELDVETSKLGGPFPVSLRASGQLSGRNVELGTETARLVEACFSYDGGKAAGRLHLGCLEAQVGGAWLYGPPAVVSDGKLEFELSGPKQTLRFDVLPVETLRTR